MKKNSNTLKNAFDQFHINVEKQAKQKLKDPILRRKLADIKKHFKRENNWPLNYVIYQELLGFKSSSVYNKVLELSGYKIYYNKRRCSVVFKPE